LKSYGKEVTERKSAKAEKRKKPERSKERNATGTIETRISASGETKGVPAPLERMIVFRAKGGLSRGSDKRGRREPSCKGALLAMIKGSTQKRSSLRAK